MSDPSSDVVHTPQSNRFERTADGAGSPATGVLTYTRDDDRVRLEHTVVPAELEGQGVGTELVAAALEWARAEGLAVVPQCSFVRAHLARHPEAAEGLEVLDL